MAKAIYSGVSSRTQIIYHSNFKHHYFGFDIQLNADKQLSIFTLDAGIDNCQSKVIDALLQGLAKLNIPCKGYACRGDFQSDKINCAFYMYAMLSELAKNPKFHEEIKTYTQGSEPPLKPGSDCKPHTILSPVVWVKPSSVPLKLITMTQSYTRMFATLLERKIPKSEAEKMMSDHKARYQYKGDTFYYINLRKQKMANRLEDQIWGRGGLKNPILGLLKTNFPRRIILTKKAVMTGLANMPFSEKIRYLIGAVGCFFNAFKLEGGPPYKASIMTNLRAALVDILTTTPRPEGAMAQLPVCTLVDGPFDFMLEFDPDDQEEKNRFRKLIDALVQDPAHQERLLAYKREEKFEEFLSRYKYERFNLLAKRLANLMC